MTDSRNREEVPQALEQMYPLFPRNAGIGGTVRVWISPPVTFTVR